MAEQADIRRQARCAGQSAVTPSWEVPMPVTISTSTEVAIAEPCLLTLSGWRWRDFGPFTGPSQMRA
jgi:hypothetical protein